MTATERLITQHIREYESRLRHIDELFERAHTATEKFGTGHASKNELNQYQVQRTELTSQTDQLKRIPVSDWRKEMIKSAGPMAVWDFLAQELEDFVERHEKS